MAITSVLLFWFTFKWLPSAVCSEMASQVTSSLSDHNQNLMQTSFTFRNHVFIFILVYSIYKMKLGPTA